MKHNLPYLKHILEEIDFLLNNTNDLTFKDFLNDEILKRASARSFEIIGEAVKNLSEVFKSEYSEIEWKKIAGMRDKIIHQYFGVNYDIIWQAITEKLPGLRDEINNLIKNIE